MAHRWCHDWTSGILNIKHAHWRQIKKSIISGCMLHWFLLWSWGHLTQVCVCAAECLCLSLHPLNAPRGFLCVSVSNTRCVHIFACVWLKVCACEYERSLRGSSPAGRKHHLFSFTGKGCLRVACPLQSCCPLVCEGYIIELAQTLWPNVGGTLSSNATLLAHYLWKEVRKNCIGKCVTVKDGVDVGWRIFL